jgi:hypothetical protein
VYARANPIKKSFFILFNLLPAIEAYIDDIIGLQLARGLIHDSPIILKDQFGTNSSR